jgi:aminoglycoside 3-N-acetyltransferase
MDATVTQLQLADDLRAVGLGAGDTVLVHSSLKQVGWIEGGPVALVQAFLDVLEPEGTLVVPTLVPALRGIRPRFDAGRTPSEMGRLTETVRTWPGARRSDHPTHSVAALGRRAETITAEHGRAHGPRSPWGRQALGFDTPWDRLRRDNARILLVGVDFSRCTLLHHAQALYLDAHEGITAQTPWPEFDFRAMGLALEAAGVVTRGTLGHAACLLARAGDVVGVALRLLEQQPQDWFRPGTPPAVWQVARDTLARQSRPQAATFKVDITPPAPTRGVARPLHARGLLLDHPVGRRAALVVCDHGGFSHQEALTIRRALAVVTDVPVEGILLSATHDHSAHHHFRAPDEAYVDFMAAQIAAGGRQAATQWQPVRAGWTTAHVPDVNRNRTVYLRDGRAYTERWLIPSSWHVKPQDMLRRGPADEELRLLLLERLDGTRLAVVADFSCHNMAGMHESRYHDDFMGVAMEVVETAEGHGCVALCTPGSEGDQNPMGLINLGEDLDLAHVLRLGRRYAGHILAAAQGSSMHDVFAVASASETGEVRVRDDWRAVGRGMSHPEMQQWATSARAPAKVTALAVGDFAMVGIPAEFFTAPAQTVREHAPFSIVAVTALVNGKLMYVAEREAFFEESEIYAVERNMPAMAVPGTDRLLSDAALRVLRQVKRVQATQGH